MSLVLDQLPDAGVQRFKKQCDHQIHCGPMNYWKQTKFVSFVSFSQIALAIGVLTSSWGVRFCGFVVGGGVLSHRESLEVSFGVCRGQGSQIQDRAVTQGVIEAVI